MLKHRRPPRGRALSLTLAALALCIAAPASASAAVTFSGSGSPSTISFPSVTTLTYKLTMTTGAGTERFAVAASVPAVGPKLVGTTIVETGPPTLAGPGTITGGSIAEAQYASCSFVPFVPFHGYTGPFWTTYLEIPPTSVSTLTFTFRTGEFPRWPGQKFAPTFQIKNIGFGPGNPGTIGQDRTITSPEPALIGKSGVRINLKLRHKVHKGLLNISGTTAPALNKQRVKLRVSRRGKKKQLTTLAKVRTNKKGHFRFKGAAPKRPGDYEVFAFYNSQSPDLLSDYTPCPKSFSVPAT